MHPVAGRHLRQERHLHPLWPHRPAALPPAGWQRPGWPLRALPSAASCPCSAAVRSCLEACSEPRLCSLAQSSNGLLPATWPQIAKSIPDAALPWCRSQAADPWAPRPLSTLQAASQLQGGSCIDSTSAHAHLSSTTAALALFKARTWRRRMRASSASSAARRVAASRLACAPACCALSAVRCCLSPMACTRQWCQS